MSAKNAIGRIFTKLLDDKRFTIPFSLVFAFVFWLVISISQNPVREQTFNDLPVTVTVENTYAGEQGLTIVSDTASQKFTVVLSGPNYIVSSVKPEDFLLTASVEDVTDAGTFSLAVTAAYNSTKSGYSFVSVTPATIDVTFDYMDTKDYKVEPQLNGFAAEDGLVAGTPTIANADLTTLSLTGPRSVLERVARVAAVADVDEKLKEAKTYEADITLYDADGQILYSFGADSTVYDAQHQPIAGNTYVTPSFTTVKVTAPVYKTKKVPLKPTFSNRPESLTDEQMVYSVTPATVEIIGAQAVVDKLESLSLGAIDFQQISAQRTDFVTAPVLPDGIRLVDGAETTFTVHIKYKETMANLR